MFKLSFFRFINYIWTYPFGGMFFIGRCRVRNKFLALFYEKGFTFVSYGF